MRRADAIEIVIGQGAKPGGGGMLLGQKVNPRVAKMRTLPAGVDQRSASRHPDWTGPDDLAIKIRELREITDWEKPIYVKVGATRVLHDVKLAVHSGADVVVVDGMQGGTAATQLAFIEHVGIPTLAAVRQAVDALEELNMTGKVQLIVSGGIRSGADAAKALALGADAVSIGQGVLFSLGCNSNSYMHKGQHIDATADYAAIGTKPGFCHHCHTGRCPVGVTTQDAVLEQRLEVETGANRVKQLPEDADHGAHHARARLRQAGCAPPGARGSGGADRGGGGHGRRAAGRHLVDSRTRLARPNKGKPYFGCADGFCSFACTSLTIINAAEPYQGCSSITSDPACMAGSVFVSASASATVRTSKM